ncbi:N-acetylmuramate alpha-1-phosphate uridylyltransferase MurU [Halothiobacillus sp.]|uniref:N-acetylmuramate alpha-1-phosphate uridylyltransferase MurU n=1 Tax=Halothiobacillus sp. TaxID=1891311 RepID=UPI00261AAC62|nr:nucleotidyltransferase family protein [Halothiobacillus sp.]
MRAMILAAGRGERLRPLTDHIPKPLIPIQGKPLIVHHIERLAKAGITDIVINLNHLAEQIPAALGDGSRWQVRLHYSWENHLPEALETAGGIRHAVALLSDTFILVNGDIFTDFPFEELLNNPLNPETDFRLVMVANPKHHPKGDFSLDQQRLGLCPADTQEAATCLTYAGIGLYQKSMFSGLPEGRRALGTLLREKIAAQRGQGQVFSGLWIDVGTQERLEQAEHSNLR